MNRASTQSSFTARDYYQPVEDVLAPQDIHDINKITGASAANRVFIVAALIMTLLHAFNLYLFLGTGIWPIIPIFLHIVISFVCGMATYSQYKAGIDVQHMAIMTITSSLTGIFGTVGALLGFLSTYALRARSRLFAEWYENIFPVDVPTEPETIYHHILEGIDENPRHYSVMPFTDVMRVGSNAQKRTALAKMTANFSPRFAPAFRLALQDKSNAIRVHTATCVAKIERNFMNILERIEQARAKEPKNMLLTLALAKFYDDYAFTGILDSELERLNRERAIHTYKAYLQQDPSAADVWTAVGRLMFRNKQWTQAAEWFRHALDRGWQSSNMVLWYFECLFRTGQFHELRRLLKEHSEKLLSQEELSPDIRGALSLWAQQQNIRV